MRTYDHFCLIARTLEQVGERWSLLVIRDLLSGPKRFTDLMKRLAGITPKTLTQRLRELTDAGLVAEDRQPGRREVWYQLTDAGRELETITDALSWWGLRHAWRWPRPGEPLHAEHLLRSLAQVIEKTENDHEPARWHFRFPDEDYLIEGEGEGQRWQLTTTAPATTADVTITATVETFVQLLFSPPGAPEPDLEIAGHPAAVERFRRLITALADVVGRP